MLLPWHFFFQQTADDKLFQSHLDNGESDRIRHGEWHFIQGAGRHSIREGEWDGFVIAESNSKRMTTALSKKSRGW
jgi:hypothetical protein